MPVELGVVRRCVADIWGRQNMVLGWRLIGGWVIWDRPEGTEGTEVGQGSCEL